MPNLQPRTHIEVCGGCHTTTRTPILIRWIEGNSGPGWPVYLCPDCAPACIDVDRAWHLAIEHAVGCQVCQGGGRCEMGEVLLRVHGAVHRARPSRP
jgi:hypothetical protein